MSESCFWVVAKEERYENQDLLTRLAITFGAMRAGQSMLTLLCSLLCSALILYCVSIIKHLNKKTWRKHYTYSKLSSLFTLALQRSRDRSPNCAQLLILNGGSLNLRFHWQFKDPIVLRGLVISSFHWLNIWKTHKQMLKMTNNNDLNIIDRFG